MYMAEAPKAWTAQWIRDLAGLTWQHSFSDNYESKASRNEQNLKRYKETGPQHRTVYVVKCKFKLNISAV